MYDMIIVSDALEALVKLNNKTINVLIYFNNYEEKQFDILRLIDKLKLGKECIYLGKDKEFDVYLDTVSNFKHYFKDGKESIEKFSLINGYDALLYRNFSFSNVFSFFIDHYKVILTLDCLALLFGFSTLTYTGYQIVTASPITLDEVQTKLANCENLTEEEYKLFYNEDLLSDVVPYYNGTCMDYFITARLNNLHICYFQDNMASEGYYNPLVPNAININSNLDVETQNETKAHEFIHVLQSFNAHKYRYLLEASAELVASEYFDFSVSSYNGTIKNLKILMEIVGPEPIKKLIFGGDDRELLLYIKENLDQEDATKLMSLLCDKPDYSSGLDAKIEGYLEKLYFKVNGKFMCDDDVIYCILENKLYGRYYFNRNMTDSTIANYSPMIKSSQYTISKVLSYKEFSDFDNFEELQFITPLKIDQDNRMVILNNGKTKSFEEAIKSGEIIIFHIFTKKVLSIEEYENLLSKGYKISKNRQVMEEECIYLPEFKSQTYKF